MKDQKNNNKAIEFRLPKKPNKKNITDDINKRLINKINNMNPKDSNVDSTTKNSINFTKLATHKTEKPNNKYTLLDFIKHKNKFQMQNNFDQNGAEQFLIERDIALREIILNENIIEENSIQCDKKEKKKNCIEEEKNSPEKNKKKAENKQEMTPKKLKKNRKKSCGAEQIKYEKFNGFNIETIKNNNKSEKDKNSQKQKRRHNSFRFSEEKKLLMEDFLESEDNQLSEICEDKRASLFRPSGNQDGYQRTFKTAVKKNAEKNTADVNIKRVDKKKRFNSSQLSLIDIINHLKEKK